MAPERLLGGSLEKPCDIYAFGMTLYEVSFGYICRRCGSHLFAFRIYANKTPLGRLRFYEFVELVVRQNVRLGQPEKDDAPQLSETIWGLAEKCRVKDPKQRPTSAMVRRPLSFA
jgi:serine/threonine protein kinase